MHRFPYQLAAEISKPVAFLIVNITHESQGSPDTAQKMKFSIKDFFNKCDQIPRIWSHLVKKSLMENFIFCAVSVN